MLLDLTGSPYARLRPIHPRNQHDGSPSSPAAQILTRSRPARSLTSSMPVRILTTSSPTRSVLQVCVPWSAPARRQLPRRLVGRPRNPAKFGLGFVSLLFDLVFLAQHYVLYWPRDTESGGLERAPIAAASAHAINGPGGGGGGAQSSHAVWTVGSATRDERRAPLLAGSIAGSESDQTPQPHSASARSVSEVDRERDPHLASVVPSGPLHVGSS